MQTISYETIFKKEKNYWWYAARREIVSHLRKKYAASSHPRALNVGCGTGGLALELKDQVNIFNLDLNSEALRFCKKKELHNLIQADAGQMPIQNNSMDEIYALDILEHLKDDLSGAKEIHRCLKPQTGQAILTVPAFQFLWSKMDHLTHHLRRYRKKDFENLLTQAGFRIRLLSYYNFFLFPVAFLFKVSEKKSTRNEGEAILPSIPNWINSLFKHTFSIEKQLLPCMRFPFGVSLIAIVEKP